MRIGSQRGFSLFEVMVCLLIVGFGMVVLLSAMAKTLDMLSTFQADSVGIPTIRSTVSCIMSGRLVPSATPQWYPSGTYFEDENDEHGQIQGYEMLTGDFKTLADANGCIYPSVIQSGANYQVIFYNNSARTNEIGRTAVFTEQGVQPITSGSIGGAISVPALLDGDDDIVTYLYPRTDPGSYTITVVNDGGGQIDIANSQLISELDFFTDASNRVYLNINSLGSDTYEIVFYWNAARTYKIGRTGGIRAGEAGTYELSGLIGGSITVTDAFGTADNDIYIDVTVDTSKIGTYEGINGGFCVKYWTPDNADVPAPAVREDCQWVQLQLFRVEDKANASAVPLAETRVVIPPQRRR